MAKRRTKKPAKTVAKKAKRGQKVARRVKRRALAHGGKRGKRRGAKRVKRGVRQIAIPAKLSSQVASYLKKTKGRYEAIGHRTVFTAFDASQTLKVDIASVAKSLVLQDGGDTIVAVVPASRNLDIKALRKVVSSHRARHGKPAARKLSFASERSIKSRLKATPGAVSPFGPMLGIETFVDRLLTKPRTIVVSGGNFETSLKMTPNEMLRLSEGIVGSFSVARPK